ncbi:hypothetical protein VPNG_09363 [Cytospora leucostoma]|uniref:Uncharacterized protein n=1 Tax=Cytospora leucostoma TaxID=1230097 RepID=A0A423VSS6_9PEZI|nr:hypothetical protein VPNG_09363 [Cytospora leucostoma]
MTFEVRDIDGHVLEAQDGISTILSKGAMVFLTECMPASTIQPPKDLSLEPGCIQEVPPTNSQEVQVPPPRKLPFTSVSTNAAIATAQSASPSRSPLTGCPEMANGESRTAVQEVSPPLSMEDGSASAVKKKHAAVQTVESDDTIKVEMKDRSANTSTNCVDAAVESAEHDDRRLPYSQSLELVSWTMFRYEEQLKKAVNVLRTSDISREDYRDKAQLAAHYLLDLERELRQMCEKALTNMS